MSEQFLGRCSICRGDIKYTEAESFVTCPACGKEQAVALFQREKIRLQKIKQEKEQAQADLKAAQQEKQAAQEKLNEAIAALADADFSKKQLEEIASQLGEDRRAFEQLMGGLQNGQSALLQTLRGPDGMQKKLQGLQTIAQYIIDTHQGDAQQLENIRDAAKTLLAGQNRFDARLATLQSTANETQKKLDALQTAWKQDKLDRVEELYRQAENARSEFRFEKAAEKYEELQLEGSKYARDPEIFWRMLLSHYGVKYQHSDAADGYVPTIFYPDLTDPAQMSLRQELFACCNAQQEKHYRHALDEIDKVLNRYRELRDATHYDVFISVKQKDGDHYTADYDKGIELYNQLKSWGLKVFNSERVTIPAGQDFEPHIIAALASAKVMIVVGTNPEYMNSDWVRNEWTRFQWLQKEEAQHGKNDRVLFCYLANGMQPGQLPKGLNPNRQAIIEGVGSDKKLRDALKTSFPQIAAPDQQPVFVSQPASQIAPASSDTLAKQLQMMQSWLIMGRYERVADKYEELIDSGEGLNNVHVYLYALCAAHKKANVDQLLESNVDLAKEQLFTYAQQFGSDKEMLQQLVARNQEWMEAERKQKADEEKQRQEEEKRCKAAAEQRRLEKEKQRKAAAEQQRLAEEERARKQAESAYEYTVNPDDTATITRYKGSNTGLVVPSQLGGRKVTQIGKKSFEQCKSLTSVKISVGVTSIGEYAFVDCHSLKRITLPDSMTSIGTHAFARCARLTSITLPEGLMSIGERTFYGCHSLTSITLPDSVTSIGEWAFSFCRSLTSITLPESVTRIGDSAFCSCDNLTSITLPESVTSIGEGAFRWCKKLTLRVVKDSYAHTYAKENNLEYQLLSTPVPTRKNTSVRMAEEDLSMYEYKTLLGGTVEIIKYTGKATTLTVPKYMREKRVTSIGERAFNDCTSLTSITLPDGVTNIGNSAFVGCFSLTSITLPDSVTSIGSWTFNKCTRLTSITLPDGVTSIGHSAFEGCGRLMSITLPDSVTSIGSYAFSHCGSLTSITLPESVTRIGVHAFSYCDSLTSITLPEGITRIGEDAFYNCDNLTSIMLPESVTNIGEGAFRGCKKLTLRVVKDSYAHTYAKKNYLKFELID